MEEGFMRRAIAIARTSLGEPGTMPYGAVVVMDGRIIGEGLNRSQSICDPTSHGEVEAIRDACRKIGAISLPDCDLYTSCEPCSMCMATICMVGIERLFYASTLADSSLMFKQLEAHDPRWARGFDALEVRREVGLPIDQRAMPAQQLLQDDANNVFLSFVQRNT